MPSGPIELHNYWKDDSTASLFLENAGYKIIRGWCWERPTPGQEPTEEEKSAIIYLILEWDYGGLLD
jgi:hypothetical protein